MDDSDSVSALVAAACEGDQRAWNELVDRYSPLLVNVIRRYRLTTSEAEDVAQTVWLRLVEHLGGLREPRALPMWLVTTGKRESLRHLSTERRSSPQDPLELGWRGPHPGQTAWATPEQEEPVQELIAAERHEALLAGLAELNPRQRGLLLLLVEDPPLSYAEISSRTGIPVGAIGPTRARAVERLRSCAPVRAWSNEADGSDPGVGKRAQASNGSSSGSRQAHEEPFETGRRRPA